MARSYLNVHPLEGRDAPAGHITATLAGGLLTLIGDDAANNFVLRVGPGSTTISPDFDTSVNGSAKGVAVVLAGTATSLGGDLAGGSDEVSIDPTADLFLPGGARLALGDGDNFLSLQTAGRIELGSLRVTAGEGFDTVQLAGGAGLGSRVNGPTILNLGPGGSQTNLKAISFPSPAGVALTSGAGTGWLNTNGVDVAGLLTASLGTGYWGGINSFNSHFGSVRVSGYWAWANVLRNTVVDGPATFSFADDVWVHLWGTTCVALSVRASGPAALAKVSWAGSSVASSLSLFSGGDATLISSPGGSLAITGDARVSGRTVAVVLQQAALVVGRDLALTARDGDARLTLADAPTATVLAVTRDLTETAAGTAWYDQQNGVAVTRDLRLNGQSGASFSQAGSITATGVGRDLIVAGGPASASVSVHGQSFSVGRDLSVTSPASAGVNLFTGGTCEVHGNTTVEGGVEGGSFTSEHTTFDGDLTLTFKDRFGNVQLWNGTVVGRAVTVTTGADADMIDLEGLTVNGPTRIVGGAGADHLWIDSHSTFNGTFSADLGSGDDEVWIAQLGGSAGPVTFARRTVIRTGAADDDLRLGVDPVAHGGDANSRVVFLSSDSVIDGGSNLNSFDPDVGQFTGIAVGTGIVHWTNPTP